MARFSDAKQIAQDYKIGGGGGGDWMKLETGDNKVRIVSEFEPLAKHFMGKGSKPQTCIGYDKGCLQCQEMKSFDEAHKNDTEPVKNPHKPSVKFLMWVIDRKDGAAKIGEFGWTVIKALSDLGEDEEYAFNKETGLPEYDINIKKVVTNPTPSGTEYSVVPSRANKPLTAEEVAIIKALKPIKQVVDSIKAKVLKEYEAMGISGKAAEAAPEDAVPPDFLAP